MVNISSLQNETVAQRAKELGISPNDFSPVEIKYLALGNQITSEGFPVMREEAQASIHAERAVLEHLRLVEHNEYVASHFGEGTETLTPSQMMEIAHHLATLDPKKAADTLDQWRADWEAALNEMFDKNSPDAQEIIRFVDAASRLSTSFMQ